MKKPNLTLFFVSLFIFSYFIWLAFRDEKQHTFTPIPEEKINIKQPIEVDTSKYKSDKGK